MAGEIGFDISRYQGILTQDIVSQMIDAGYEYGWLRFSQGSTYKDPYARKNTELLLKNNFPLGPYHFTTTDDANLQYNNFVSAVGDLASEFKLPPFMDCEAYTQSITPEEMWKMLDRRNVYPTVYWSHGGILTWTDIKGGWGIVEPEVQIAYELRVGKPDDSIVQMISPIRGYTYPTYQIVDSLGMKLTTWMVSYPLMGRWAYPGIYTNYSSGNHIFVYNKCQKMSRYLLIVANWGVTVPNKPAIWKNTEYLSWQDKVIQQGQFPFALDHQVWGKLMPFPKDEPEPPQPDKEQINVSFTYVSNPTKVYTGILTEE